MSTVLTSELRKRRRWKSRRWSAIISCPITLRSRSGNRSLWRIAGRAQSSPLTSANPLGLYVHIPFCRKRCHFCYFKVYTDKDAAAIRNYLDAVLREFVFTRQGLPRRTKAQFHLFRRGTPSYLSVNQLRHLADGMKALLLGTRPKKSPSNASQAR